MNFANHWLKWKLSYWDLDPGDSRHPMMCRWNSQIKSDCDQQYLNPSHPLSPSPLPLGSSHFSYLVPYHRPVCCFAHCHTLFHNNFLWYKSLALICINNPLPAFAPGIVFSHMSRNTSLPKNTLFLCRTIFWKVLFPLLYYYIFFLISPCQLIISKE